MESPFSPREIARLARASVIEANRIDTLPELEQIIIAIDPSTHVTGNGDACGIIAMGRAGNTAYILEDASLNAAPSDWAKAAAELANRHAADEVLAEGNQGGGMVKNVLESAGIALAIKIVHAVKGKRQRAAPIAALYRAGRVHHVGHFPNLEAEMLSFGQSGKSPNRLDALVWGLAHLLLNTQTPRIRQL